MKKKILPILVTIIFLTIGITPVYAFDQYESMKVGETKTFYFPSEVTSRASSMYAYNCTSDHINNVEVVSYTNTSVTVKALSYTQYTVNIRFDYWWYENGYGRTDTHMVHIDLYESGGGGGGNTDGNENPGDYYWDKGCWGTINIYEGKSTTVYCKYDAPNPDKVKSIVWSHYGAYGYEITSQSRYSCTIKGSFGASNQKLWCLMKYGSTSYKTYYIVNVLKDTKETLKLTANPNGGTVEEGTVVKLSSSVSGSDIYYTLDGNKPTTNSLKYKSSGISINRKCTLKAFAQKSGYNDSPVMTWVFTVKEENKIEINATNFPDENFRKYLLEQDYGKDGVLTNSEIKNIKKLYVGGKGLQIKSLKGIEYFTELDHLDCHLNNIESLSLSSNKALVSLDCGSNKLKEIDLSKNTNLEYLQIERNDLKTLDFSNNKKITRITMYYNDIRGSGMDSFINSLPNYGSGDKHEIYMINTLWEDGNKCTKSQVKKIKEKGWTPYYTDGEWHEYEGEDDSEIIYVSAINLNLWSTTISVGNSKQLIATVKPDDTNDKSVTWSSSNTNVATVNNNGLVTAKSVGSATIICKANDGSGKQKKCYVTVEEQDNYKPIGVGIFRDDFYEDETEVEILQNQKKKYKYLILRPYDGITNYNKGSNYKGVEEVELTILSPGWSLNNISITLNDLVYFHSIGTGYYYDEYGAYIDIYHPSVFTNMQSEEYWTHNKVISYQNNGLPDKIQLAPVYYMDDNGGWDCTQEDNVIIITFPKNASGIEGIRNEDKKDTRVFDLYGRQLSEPQKGINIINGKKYVRK